MIDRDGDQDDAAGVPIGAALIQVDCERPQLSPLPLLLWRSSLRTRTSELSYFLAVAITDFTVGRKDVPK